MSKGSEIARILRAVAEKVERGQMQGSTRDINGNTVGLFGPQGSDNPQMFVVTIDTESATLED